MWVFKRRFIFFGMYCTVGHMCRLTKSLCCSHTQIMNVYRDHGTISDNLVILYMIIWVFKRWFMFFLVCITLLAIKCSGEFVNMLRLTRALLLAYIYYERRQRSRYNFRYLVILYTIMWVFNRRFMFFWYVLHCWPSNALVSLCYDV